jgi:hypothetical protein
MNNEYVVKDLDNFVLTSRELVFNNFGKDQNQNIEDLIQDVGLDELEEFNSVLSQEESMIIAKSICRKQTNKKTKAIRYVITDDLFMQMIMLFNDRMVSNMLNGLVNKGLLETAFDTESNDFIFWAKDEHKEKPETD